MVAQTNIAQMARLIAIINAQQDSAAADPAPTGQPLREAAPAGSTVPGDGNVAAMKTILERFYRGAESAADHLAADTPNDRVLREAMMTAPTDDGLTMGLWQIRAKTDSGRKLYDVVRIDQSAPIAQDLTLYEAARGLASALNDGLPITARRIRDLLNVEEDYANAVHNAIHAKVALGRPRLNAQRRAILEDKYGAAVRRGHAARSRIFAMVGRG